MIVIVLQYIRRWVIRSRDTWRLSADGESLRLYHEADMWSSWIHSFSEHHTSWHEGLMPFIVVVNMSSCI